MFALCFSLGSLLVELWPRVAAKDHSNCAFGLLWRNFVWVAAAYRPPGPKYFVLPSRDAQICVQSVSRDAVIQRLCMCPVRSSCPARASMVVRARKGRTKPQMSGIVLSGGLSCFTVELVSTVPAAEVNTTVSAGSGWA